MNRLGAHFNVDYSKVKAKEEVTFTGNNYRVTVLSECLVRLEYSLDGIFEDRPTELALCRDFVVPEFKVEQDEKYLEIKTKYFTLNYAKGKPYEASKIAPDSNLKVVLNDTDKMWYPGHAEARNFYGTNVSIENKTKVKLEKGLYSTDGFCSIDDSKSLIIDEDGYLHEKEREHVDMYLFMYRRDFGRCLKDYFTLTGKPPLIPRWALGIWWNRDIPYSFIDAKKLVTEFNRNNIPLSILLLGNSWHKQNLINKKPTETGFSFNNDLYPNPTELFSYMHDRGIRVGLTINPEDGILPTEDRYTDLIADTEAKPGAIIPFNVFNKTFLIKYFQTMIYPLNNYGTDFFFIEYNVDSKPLRALNYYHYNDYKKDQAKRGLILSRNGLLASHRYPTHYSGKTLVSWKTLENLPYFNSTASNIGVSWWSHDIGGFEGGIEDSELYMRYVQLGTYSPIFRFASKAGHYYKREPWRWDVKTFKVVQEYCNLRHRLVPYLYNEGYKYAKTGLPLIQPLYYRIPEIYDEPAYKNEYYFGSELFVAPITKPKDSVMNRAVERVYLPSGMWYDFKTGKKFPGNKRYVLFFKDEDYPVFAKSGSIVPLADLEENINVTNPPKSLEIHVFPGASNIYNLYEDDGTTKLNEEGYYIVTRIDYNYLLNNHTIIIRPVEGKSGIIPEERNYRIRFRNSREADEVVVYEGEEKTECYSYADGADFVVEIDNVSTTTQLTINCKGKDIEIDAVRLINEDIDSIINDLHIKTTLKEEIASIVFDKELEIRKKRIAVRKLSKKGLDQLFIRMFIKLLEYVAEI